MSEPLVEWRPCHRCQGRGLVREFMFDDVEVGNNFRSAVPCPLCLGAKFVAVYRIEVVADVDLRIDEEASE